MLKGHKEKVAAGENVRGGRAVMRPLRLEREQGVDAGFF